MLKYFKLAYADFLERMADAVGNAGGPKGSCGSILTCCVAQVKEPSPGGPVYEAHAYFTRDFQGKLLMVLHSRRYRVEVASVESREENCFSRYVADKWYPGCGYSSGIRNSARVLELQYMADRERNKL